MNPISSTHVCLLALTLFVGTPTAHSATNADANTTTTDSAQPELSAEQTELKRITEQKNLLSAKKELSEQKLLKELEAQILEQKRLKIEGQLHDEQRKRELAELKETKEELELDYQLLVQQQKNELVKLELDKNRLTAERALTDAQLSRELTDLETQKKLLAAQTALAEQKLKKELSVINAEKARIAAQNEKKVKLLEQKELEQRAEKATLTMELSRMKAEQARMSFEKSKLAHARMETEDRLTAMTLRMDLTAKNETLKAHVEQDVDYPDVPFDHGMLRITDRRIELNGPIFSGAAQHVSERIHFFNNRSVTQPIFLVIDDSPGGSVMEGYRIIKAMQSSEAPVYAIVKSFAASMAAVIVALAEHSYAFPNAIILHHQMHGLSWGNQTQLQEVLDYLKEWERRLHGPVAKKMGLTTEQFVKRMYEHNSNGDWREFADIAKTLNWITDVVNEVREEGIIEKPTEGRPQPRWLSRFEEIKDKDGRRFVQLPRLNPCDFYFMHNPDAYYR